MATVAEVTLAAREWHPALHPRSTPDIVVRNYLAEKQDWLLGEIAEIKADAVHASETITLPLADFRAGYTIQTPYFRLHGGTAVMKQDERRIDLRLVPYVDRLERYSGPAAYDQAGTLFLLGTEDDWTHYDRIELDLFPSAPAPGDEITGQDSAFILPGRKAKAALISMAAVFMALRVDDFPGSTLAEFRRREDEAIAAYLDEVTGRRRATVNVIRGVW